MYIYIIYTINSMNINYLSKDIQNGKGRREQEINGEFDTDSDTIIDIKKINNDKIKYLNRDSYYNEWNENIGEWVHSDKVYYNEFNKTFLDEMNERFKIKPSEDKYSLSNNQFYQHLLFDEYAKNDYGNQAIKVLELFIDYLNKYGIGEFKKYSILLRNYYDNGKLAMKNILLKILNIDKYEYRLNSLIRNIKKKNLLILSGYVYGDKAHAINIYISYNNDIYIINSGEGIDHVEFVLGYKKTNNNGPVIIKYTNIDDDMRYRIIALCACFENLQTQQCLKNIIKCFNEYSYIFPHLNKNFEKSDKKICSKFIYYCISDTINQNVSGTIFILHKEEKEQLSGSCSFYSSFYFIKNFLNMSNNQFTIFNDYLIKESIELYCNILYNDYINSSYKIQNPLGIKFYNDFILLMKNYNFDNKINFLKIYENIVKNKNNSYIEIPIKNIRDNEDNEDLFLSFLKEYSRDGNINNLFLKYMTTSVNFRLDTKYYKFAKILYFNKILDIVFNEILTFDINNIYTMFLYKWINIFIDKGVNNWFNNNIFMNMSSKFKLLYIYSVICVKNNVKVSLLLSIQEEKIKNNIKNYMYDKENKDYFFNYIKIYDYMHDNINKINFEYIEENGSVCETNWFFDIVQSAFKDYKTKLKIYSDILKKENGLENLLNIINIINNDNINYVEIYDNYFQILDKYKINDFGNCMHSKTDNNLFNIDYEYNSINDNYVKLNLYEIINILDIDKYIQYKNKISDYLNNILICLIYCIDKSKYEILIEYYADIDILKIIKFYYLKLNEDEYIENEELYKSLIYNVLLQSDVNKSIEIFEIFSGIYNDNYNTDDFYIHEILICNNNNLKIYKKKTQDNSQILYYKNGNDDYSIINKNLEEKYITINNINFNPDIPINEINIYLDNVIEKSDDFLNNKLAYSNTINIKFKTLDTKRVYHILTDYKDTCFYIEKNITYFQNNKNTFKVNIDINDPTLSMWILFMSNGFILEDFYGNKYILILINNNEYFKIIEFDNKHINKYHILKLHFTNLYILNNDYDDMSSLLLSLVISKNNTCQYLIYKHFYNIYLKNINNPESIYSKYIKKLYDNNSMLNKKNDVPYWALFEKYTNKNNYKMRKEYLKIDEIQNIDSFFNLIELKNTNEYIICKQIIKEINYEKNIIIPEENKNKDTQNFLSDFRYKCSAILNIKDKIVLNTSKDNNYFINIINNNFNIEYVKNEIKNTNNTLFNICNLYTNNYIYFYKMLIKKIFNEIKKNFNKFILEPKSHCVILLKIFEKIDDKIIYGFDKRRNIGEIIFELHDEVIIRRRQKRYIKSIYNDLNNEKYNKIYQILMGVGKTSTITPILILNSYFKDNNKSINIILPEHLVNDSFNIMFKYSNVLLDFNITHNNINFDKCLNILSDFSYKKYIHDNIDFFNNTENYENVIKKSLFILDEMDTIIDPLKSELNISNENKEYHIMHKEITDIYISIYLYNIHLVIADKNINDIIENKIKKINNYLKNNNYSKNYGFGTKNFENKNYYYYELELDKHFFIAIPYKANFTPSNGSVYSDFELSVCLTIQSYLKNKFRKEDIELIFLEMFKYKENIYLINIIFYIFTSFIKYAKLKFLYVNNNLNFNSECFKIAEKINDSDDFINLLEYYLKHFIFYKFFKISTTQFTISAIDMISNRFMHRRIAFSGTVSFFLPQNIIKDELLEDISNIDKNINEAIITQYNEIKSDDYSNGAVQIAFNGLITEKTIIKNYDTLSIEKEKILLDYILKNINIDSNGNENILINNLNALIDASGIFLINKTEDILKLIYNKIPTRKIFFIDENDNKKIYNGIDIKSSQKYNNEIFQDVFIYYDNKHCVGVDFKQPFIMKGLVTVSDKNTMTEVSQAMYRLRNLNIGHSLIFYIPDNIVNLINLYEKLEKNQEEYKESTKNKAIIQCARYLNSYIYRNISTYETSIFYDLYKYNENGDIQKNISDDSFDYITECVYNNNKIYFLGEVLNIKFKNNTNCDIETFNTGHSQSQEQSKEQSQEHSQEHSQKHSQETMIYDNSIFLETMYKNVNTYEDYYNSDIPICNVYIKKRGLVYFYPGKLIQKICINEFIIDNYKLKISINSLQNVENSISIYNNSTCYYFYINISKKYILILVYRELFELFINTKINTDKYIILDIKGNNVYFKDSKNNEREIEINTLKKIKLLFTNNNFDIIDKFNILCDLYTNIKTFNDSENIKYLLYSWSMCFIGRNGGSIFYDFLFWNKFSNEQYIIKCDENLFIYTFFENFRNNPVIIEKIKIIYNSFLQQLLKGGRLKKYKIIKN